MNIKTNFRSTLVSWILIILCAFDLCTCTSNIENLLQTKKEELQIANTKFNAGGRKGGGGYVMELIGKRIKWT